MNNSRQQLRAGASGYAEDARGIATQALENTREFANDAFERAGEKMRDLRYGVKDLANRGASSVSDYSRATTRYVSEQPVKSALIAAAVGAVVAGVIIAMRRNRDYY